MYEPYIKDTLDGDKTLFFRPHDKNSCAAGVERYCHRPTEIIII